MCISCQVLKGFVVSSAREQPVQSFPFQHSPSMCTCWTSVYAYAHAQPMLIPPNSAVVARASGSWRLKLQNARVGSLEALLIHCILLMQGVHHWVPFCRYKRVNASCLRASPTALWWQAAKGQLAERSFLEAHVEDNADYDGVAVKWGLGNKAASAQACAQACLEHVPAVQVPGKP